MKKTPKQPKLTLEKRLSDLKRPKRQQVAIVALENRVAHLEQMLESTLAWLGCKSL